MTLYSPRAQVLSQVLLHTIRDSEVTVWFALFGLSVSIAAIASYGNAAMEFLLLAG
jgi:hypothetical protein